MPAIGAAAGISNFVGLEYLTGRIGDRKGGFHLCSTSVLSNRATISTLNVITGSGTGDFEGIRGHMEEPHELKRQRQFAGTRIQL